MPLTIVKLGGSLQHDPALPRWLAALARHAGKVAVVPGGGAFADAARAAQAHWRFGDLHAHNMAILGMAQMAQLMRALEPALVLARDMAAVRRALADGAVPLWQPLDLLRNAPDELTTWDVTSDSLAAWLARRLDAQALWLVKACAVPVEHDIAALAVQGIVDTALPSLLRDWPGRCRVVTAGEMSAADISAGLAGA